MQGRSIRLFLIDGTPQGMRTAEVGNWMGLALVCPRTDLARLANRGEVHRTGVYILVGPSESSASGLAVYVGEGDDVWARLSSHDDKKDFWTWVVLFVSKDENLTNAHVRWLESRLVMDVTKAKRAEVTNGNAPGGNKLPEADTADMETYYENVRVLMPTLGVNVFAADAPTASKAAKKDAFVLELRWEDARAECIVADGQFLIQPGSTARAKEVDSLGEGRRRSARRSGSRRCSSPTRATPPSSGSLRSTRSIPLRRGRRRYRDRLERARSLEGEGQGGLVQGVAGEAGHRGGVRRTLSTRRFAFARPRSIS